MGGNGAGNGETDGCCVSFPAAAAATGATTNLFNGDFLTGSGNTHLPSVSPFIRRMYWLIRFLAYFSPRDRVISDATASK